MNKISANFIKTAVGITPLAANSISDINDFLKSLPDYKGFRTLPLISADAKKIEAMLLIPGSQMQDLMLTPKLLQRGLDSLYEQLQANDKNELTFRAVQVLANGSLGKQTELISFTRKALLTVLADPSSLKLIQTKLKNPKYSPEKVLNAYKQTRELKIEQQAQSIKLKTANPVSETPDAVKEQELALREAEQRRKEQELTAMEAEQRQKELALQQEADRLKQEQERLIKLQARIESTLSPIPSSVVPINPQPEPEVIAPRPAVIDTGRPNDNPDDADRQKLLSMGISGEKASKHASFATY